MYLLKMNIGKYGVLKVSIKQFIYETFYQDKIKELELLELDYIKIETSLKTLAIKYNDMKLDSDNKDIEISKLKQLFNQGWTNPYNWTNYTGKYSNFGNLGIPPNGMIIINDKNIKQQALRLKGNDIKTTADNIKNWINKHIYYTRDMDNSLFNGGREYFIPANITYYSRHDDCEGYATLFQSMMHILGYGDKCVVCIAKNINSLVTWVNGEKIGHGWNKVLIDDVWVDYDANAGIYQDKCIYPALDKCTYWFNYYNVFK